MAIHLNRVREPEPPHPFAVRPHHCALSVPDLETAIVWYREMLGFALEIRQEMPEVPLKGAFLKRGEFRIELFELPGAQRLPTSRRDVHEDLRTHGTKHMALEVPNVAGALRFLEARGVEVAMAPIEVDGTVACYIRDNSGNLIELVEPFPV